tara:strand:- start:7237 stop:7806 length:570 start_codon:yes stop_codon:yes gene_type:complete
MALYGESRDISLFRHVNRELMGNVMSQQVVYYKPDIKETIVNMYGEASKERFWNEPVLLNAIVERNDQQFTDSSLGVDFNWGITFKFLRDDLLNKLQNFNADPSVYGGNLVPEVGDVIMYDQGYYEVDTTNANQYFVGKNPDYPYTDDNGNNPLNNFELDQFGYSVSIICSTHYVPADKFQISPYKERF